MPRSQEETEKFKEIKKDQILNAALYEFAFKGYVGVTIDDISKRANITRSLFYHYFKDKEDAFLSLVDRTTKKVDDIFSQIDLCKNILDVLDDLIMVFTNILTDEKESLSCIIYMLLNMYYERDYLPKPKEEIKKRINLFSFVNDINIRGIKEEVFISANPKELSLSFLAMMKGFAFNRIIVGKENFICPSKNIIKNLFIRKDGQHEKE